MSIGDLPVASWGDARACLMSLLDSDVGPEPGVITISNVKRLFRSCFQLELSETVLGHTRLFDLLTDPYFHDVCSVEPQGDGQVVVRRNFYHPLSVPPSVWFMPQAEHGDMIGGDAAPFLWPSFPSAL